MTTKQTAPFAFLLFGLASVFIITWGIRSSAAVLNPILLAAVITIVVLPLPEKLTKRGMPGWLSFVLTFLAVVGVIALVVVLVLVSTTQMTADISGQSSTQDQTTDADNQTAAASSAGLLSSDQMTQLYQAILGAAGQAVVLAFTVLIIFMFMLGAAINKPSSASRLGLSPDSTIWKRSTQLTKDVQRYMSIMTAVNLLVGIGDAIFLMIIGVEYAILWGLLAWLTGYIPTVGFWIAMIPPLALAWSQNGPETALIVLGGYVLINGSVQNFVQPHMMGQGLGISPVVIFISLFVWGWLLGGVGAILAVPLTMLIMSVLNSFDNTRWIATLMSVAPDQKSGDSTDAHDKLHNTWEGVKHLFTPNDDEAAT